MAVAHDVIQQNGSTYAMGDKKLGYYKSWRQKEEVWEEIIPILEERIKSAYRYGASLDEPAIMEIGDDDQEKTEE